MRNLTRFNISRDTPTLRRVRCNTVQYSTVGNWLIPECTLPGVPRGVVREVLLFPQDVAGPLHEALDTRGQMRSAIR